MTRWWSVHPVRPSLDVPRLSALAVMAILVASGSAVAQTTPSRPTPAGILPSHDTQNRGVDGPVLSRLVTVSLNDVTLEAALREIEAKSGVLIGYGDRVVPFQRRVTFSATDMPVLTALQTVLRGTNVGVKLTTAGKVTLYRLDRASEDSVFGTLVGQVTDGAKHGISLVRVAVDGTKRIALTNADGRYTLARVPAGKYSISARLLGYGASMKSVTVSGPDTVVTDFSLSAVPSRLQEVVTTGAGERQRLEVGNSIAVINADSVAQHTPLRNFSDLLQTRAPGVQVISTSGTVGSGSRIRIRGVSSVLASSDPIVIIDGVRMDASYSQTPADGSGGVRSAANNQLNDRVPATSRLNDIDPDMIETIEVLKGPSAATLYGSDAANGVIVVKTKRGHAGATRWSASGTRGWSHMDATFMDAWLGWGSGPTAGPTADCTLADELTLYCKQDSVTHYNPLNHKDSSPLGTGTSNRYNMQVSGGSSTLQYFLGGSYNDDVGLLKMPSAQADKLAVLRNGAPLPEWADRPNVLNGMNVTTNLTTQVNQKLDLALNGAASSQYHRDAPQGSTGFVTQSLTSAGYRDSVGQGWGTAGPGDQFLQRTSDNVRHFTAGVTGNAHPTPNLSGRVVAGVDYSTRRDEILRRTEDALSQGAPSMRGRNDAENLMRNLDVSGTLNVPLSERVRLRSTAGGQYTRSDYNSAMLQGTGLVSGSDVIDNAQSIGLVSERNSASATAGWFIDESVGLNERLFVNMAVRGDAGSAFGRNAKAIVYPKFSASWLISQESFFPKSIPLSNLRFRAAFGQAGVQPATDARIRSYRSSNGLVNGVPVGTTVITTIGNTGLLPERSAEFEGGMDFGLWNDRVTMDVTTYRKATHDALITRTLPPSLGVTSRQENIGQVDNRGTEISSTIRPISTRALDWSINVGYSRNRNKLVTLGNTNMDTNLPTQTRYAAGYPLDGYWGRVLLGYSDIDGNGIISPNEIQVSDSVSYAGQALPKAEVSLHNDISLFTGRLLVAAGLAYSGGGTQYNSALWNQCASRRCQMVTDRDVGLAAQALTLAGGSPTNAYYGAYEHVSWWRFTDLSVTYNAPISFARALRTQSASVSLMARNLALWTNYRGADPEVNTSNYNNNTVDAGGVPQTRDWSLRVNLSF